MSTSFRLFIVGLFTCLASVSFAGFWTVSYSGGQATVWGAGNFPYGINSQGQYGGGGSGASGQISATFTWNYGSGSAGPPDGVFVLEYCKASAIGNAGASANNGLDSKIITTSSPYPGSTATCEGTRLSYVYVGGSTTFQVTASPSAGGNMSASVWYSAAVVPKAVTINTDRDLTYHKGPNGPVSNTTNIATPRYTDVWVDPASEAYGGMDPYPPIYYLVTLSFLRELLGTAWTNPYHQWTSEGALIPSYTDDFLHEFEWITPEWILTPDEVAALGENGPITKTVKLTVTDDGGNGISLTAENRLRIHNKYENWQTEATLPSIFEQAGNFTPASPGYALGGGGIQCTWTEAGPYWAALQSAVSAVMTVTDPFIKNPYFKAGFKALGITVDSLGPKPNNGVAPWAWNWPGSEIDGGDWNVNQQFYRMEPMLEVGYNVFRQVVDQYGPSGYVGQARDVKRKQNGAYRWTGSFIRNDGTEGGGQG